MFDRHKKSICSKKKKLPDLIRRLSAKTQSDRDIQRGICYGLITSSLLPKLV